MPTNLVILDEKTIKEKMYYIRGQYVMIDSDLAEIYGYTTKYFNRQVKNNIEKFDNDFMFQLTDEEYKNFLRCKNFTSKNIEGSGGRRYNPYVFTEQGIYMLMTVLKGELAIKQSKALIRIFKQMKDYIVHNSLNQDFINSLVLDNYENIKIINNDIKLLKETFSNLEENILKQKIYIDGQEFDSYLDIIKILNKAKNEIIIVDNYADYTLLEIISEINKNVKLITKKNNKLKDIDISKYNKQYHNLRIYYSNLFHDRFIILDKKIIYSIGSSVNYIGSKVTLISKIEEDEIKKVLLNKIDKVIN